MATHPPDPHPRRLADEAEIVDVTIRYCRAVDRRDWSLFRSCFTDIVSTEAAGTTPADEFATLVASVLDGFDRTQHLVTNHLVTFDEHDPGRATVEFQMYAQHLLTGSAAGEYYLLRAEYTEVMRRGADGWRVSSITTSNRWEEGNLGAIAEAAERVKTGAA